MHLRLLVRGSSPNPPYQQGGVVLFMTLITLLILLIAGIALIRSINTSATTAGNLAFQRDLTNQAELGWISVRNAFLTGGLSSQPARQKLEAAENYYPIKLPSASNGIPQILLESKETFGGTFTHADLVSPSDSNIIIRYVIDRMCVDPTTPTQAVPPKDPGTVAVGALNCVVSIAGTDSSGTDWLRKPTGTTSVAYRVSIAVVGPRNTRAYFQTTISAP